MTTIQTSSTRPFARRRFLAGLAGAGALLACRKPAAAAALGRTRNGPGLFGSRESRRDGGARFPKWQGALDRTLEERRNVGDACRRDGSPACYVQEWQRLLDSLAHLAAPARLDVVNREMNRRAYVLDPMNWGVPDYWASPGQFFRRNGDCEDYAIAKYMSLRALGYPLDAMRVVVLQDENLDVPHAILAVRTGGDEMILDNQINQVVSHRAIRHYRPIFSINEEAWWLHH